MFLPIAESAVDFRCAVDLNGDGAMDQTGTCDAGTKFGGGADYLCPLGSANCSLRNFTCSLDNKVYSDKAKCDTGCIETSACEVRPSGLSRTGKSSFSACYDKYIYARAYRPNTSDASFTIQYLDTSPNGTAHHNCSGDGGVGDGWHSIGTVDLWDTAFTTDPVEHSDINLNLCFYFYNWNDYQPKCITSFNQSILIGQDDAPGSTTDTFSYYYNVDIPLTEYSCRYDEYPFTPAFQPGSANAHTIVADPTPLIVDVSTKTEGYYLTKLDLSPSGDLLVYGNLATKTWRLIDLNQGRPFTQPNYVEGWDNSVDSGATQVGTLVLSDSAKAFGAPSINIIDPELFNSSLPLAQINNIAGSTIEIYKWKIVFVQIAGTRESRMQMTLAATITLPGLKFRGAVCPYPLLCSFGRIDMKISDSKMMVNATCNGNACVIDYGLLTKVEALPNILKFSNLDGYAGEISVENLGGVTPPQACTGSPKSCTKIGTCPEKPVCPTGFNCDCTSGTAPTCSDSGSLNTSSDKCEITTSKLCPVGMSYDATEDACVADPVCSGGTYNPTKNRCENNLSIKCPTGYAFNNSTWRCEATIACPANTSWDDLSGKCRSSKVCDPGKSYDSVNGKCFEPSTCSVGGLQTSRDKCEEAPFCLANTSYNVSSNVCQAASTSICASGYSLISGKCEKSIDCNYGSWDASANQCSGSIQCGGAGYTSIANGAYCTAPAPNPLCATGDSYVTTRPKVSSSDLTGPYPIYSCVRGYSFSASISTCPSGYTLKSYYRVTKWYNDYTYYYCAKAPACPFGGSWNPSAGECRSTATCPSGTLQNQNTCVSNGTCTQSGTVNVSSNRCQLNAIPECMAGTSYNSTRDKCEVSSTCSNGLTLNTVSDRCDADPQCLPGLLYNTVRDRCEVNAAAACPSGTVYNSGSGYCEASLNCPAPGALVPREIYTCEATATFSCPAGYTESPDRVCEKAPACDKGIYSASADKCKITGDSLCPSAYAFNATADLCQKPPLCSSGSYDNASDKCCQCESPNACITTLSNPTLSDYSCSPNSCVDIGNSANVTPTTVDMTYFRDDAPIDSSGQCLGEFLLFSGKPELCRTSGIQTNYTNCCNNTDYSKLGCTPAEVETNIDVNAGKCHKIGRTCAESWNGVGCVQQQDVYCCFNGIMARITHEQGRTQVDAFAKGVDGMWGNFESPNCRGFTPLQFQSIDFSRVDYSEWINSIMPPSSAPADSKNSMENKVNDYYNRLK
ncbi:MAG: conjugal transfer protein TraN [Nitrospinota bacterium]|nr:conjugal transfer protein TraN [Nitrospinota bacterium]